MPPVFLSVILLVLSMPVVSHAKSGDVYTLDDWQYSTYCYVNKSHNNGFARTIPLSFLDNFAFEIDHIYRIDFKMSSYVDLYSVTNSGQARFTVRWYTLLNNDNSVKYDINKFGWTDTSGVGNYPVSQLTSVDLSFEYNCLQKNTFSLSGRDEVIQLGDDEMDGGVFANVYYACSGITITDITPRELQDVVENIDKNVEEGIHGYDNSAAVSDNERLENQYQEYQQAEDNLINNIDVNYDFGGNPFLQFPAAAQLISATIAGYLSAIGDFYTVIVVVFAISVVMFILGRRKGG